MLGKRSTPEACGYVSFILVITVTVLRGLFNTNLEKVFLPSDPDEFSLRRLVYFTFNFVRDPPTSPGRTRFGQMSFEVVDRVPDRGSHKPFHLI